MKITLSIHDPETDQWDEVRESSLGPPRQFGSITDAMRCFEINSEFGAAYRVLLDGRPVNVDALPELLAVVEDLANYRIHGGMIEGKLNGFCNRADAALAAARKE